MHALRSCLKLICQYEFPTLPNKRVSKAKDNGKTTSRSASLITNHTALILGVHPLRSYLKLICQYEFQSLPNKKVSSEKHHGKNSIEGQTSPIPNHTALLFGVHPLRSYLKLICQYEFQSLPK